MKSPFKFLDPYEFKDRDAFFGRDAETRELYNLVTKNRLTFVYGPSGIGKTSLIQCGLAARFRGIDWIPLFIRPGSDINIMLRRELGRALGMDTIYEGELTEAIETLFKRYLRPVYLIFDQFEELFILKGNKDNLPEQLLFYNTISDLVEAELPCRIIFSMREDYFGYLVHFEKVIPELYSRKLRVEPMNRENLMKVITGSCKAYHIGFGNEAKDAEQIIENLNAGRSGGHIPFIQVYLHMLFREAERQALKSTAKGATPVIKFDAGVIEAVGPISDVLNRFLKDREVEIYQYLINKGIKAPEDILQRVLDPFVSDDGTRIPVPFMNDARNNIVLQGSASRQLAYLPNSLVSICIEELEKSRILRLTDQEIELAHDTLAAFVNKHRSDEQRQINDLRRRIEIGYREYQDANGQYFFDRNQLARLEPFMDRIALEPGWGDFLSASWNNVFQREQAEIRQAREKLRRQWALSILLILIAALTSAMAAWAVLKQREAAEANQRAQASLLIAQQEKAEAQIARDIARNNEQRAVSAESDARNKAEMLAKTLFELGKSNEQVVDALAEEANRDIYHLEYRSAAEDIKTAAALGRTTQAFRRVLQEVLFFRTEAGQITLASKLISDVGLKPYPNLKDWVRQLDPTHYKTLQKRYYPSFDMITVSGNTFTMGGMPGDAEAESDEQPRHTVRLDDYQMARTETTVWQFALYAAATGQDMKSLKPDWGFDGDNPVGFISWFDAVLYSNWLSHQLGYGTVYSITSNSQSDPDGFNIMVLKGANGFCLPTEAEWEYAAGQTALPLSAFAWYNENCDSNGIQRARAVGTRKPNALGFFDLAGNHWEWCQDWYAERYYETGRDKIMENPQGPASGVERVYRGGSWKLDATYCRTSGREFLHPGEAYVDFGFRIVRRKYR